MPEALADHLHRDTGSQRDRRVGVPQVVEPDARNTRMGVQPLEHDTQPTTGIKNMNRRKDGSARQNNRMSSAPYPCRKT